MLVWVKVGEDNTTDITITGKKPYFDDLKTAIKFELPNKFHTTDKHKIVIRDPRTNVRIASNEPLALDGNKRGTVSMPFIVDDPEQGILGNAVFLFRRTTYLRIQHRHKLRREKCDITLSICQQ